MGASESQVNAASKFFLAGLLVLAWRLGAVVSAALGANPFAAEVVAAQGPFGAWPYDDPSSTLGMPATNFYDPLAGWSGGNAVRRVKLVESAYHLDSTQTQKLITTLREGSHIVLRFAPPIQDDPAHPYGMDFLVFGNALYPSLGFVDDDTDMNTLLLAGGDLVEPMKVSVSPGYTGKPGQSPTDWQTWDWYCFENGPYADTAFPTHAYRWNRGQAAWSSELMDFTKPVNPALGALLDSAGSVPLSAADAIDLYDGSAGGTGFDLAESGFAAIEYVKVEGTPGFAGGELDGVAAVRPMVLGDSLTIAPANLTNGGVVLRFQQPGQAAEPALALHFTAVSEVARVATVPLPVPPFLTAGGRVLTATRLDLTPALGSNTVAFQARLQFPAGPSCQDDGSDLVLLRQAGTNWESVAFAFEHATRSAEITVTNHLPTLALVQLQPPRASIALAADPMGGPLMSLRFAALPGCAYTLERTQDFKSWEERASITPMAAHVAVLQDAGLPGGAFYRVRLHRL